MLHQVFETERDAVCYEHDETGDANPSTLAVMFQHELLVLCLIVYSSPHWDQREQELDQTNYDHDYLHVEDHGARLFNFHLDESFVVMFLGEPQGPLGEAWLEHCLVLLFFQIHRAIFNGWI